MSAEGASTARDNPRTATPHSDTYPQRAHGQNSSAVKVTTGIRCLHIMRNNPTCMQTIIEGYSKIYTTTPTCIRTTSEGYSNTYTTTPTTHATNPRMMNNDLHDNSYDIHDQLPRTIQNLHNTSYDQRLPIEQRHIQLHHNHYHPETTTVRKRGRQRRPRYFSGDKNATGKDTALKNHEGQASQWSLEPGQDYLEYLGSTTFTTRG